MRCLDAEELVAYIEDFVNEQAKQAIEEHLRTCAACRSVLKDMQVSRDRLIQCAHDCSREELDVREKVMDRILRECDTDAEAIRLTHDPLVSIDMKRQIALMGHENPKVSEQACSDLIRCLHVHHDCALEYLRDVEDIGKLLMDETRRIVRHALRLFKCHVVAYDGQVGSLSDEEVAAMFEDESTTITELVSGPARRVYLARIHGFPDGMTGRCKGLLSRLGDSATYVIAASAGLRDSQLLETIGHELQHMVEIGAFRTCRLAVHGESSLESPFSGGNRGKYVSFVTSQLGFRSDEKTDLAKWIVQHMPLKSGAGILIESGSSCLQIWNQIVKCVKDGIYANLVVYTNSDLVIEVWRDNIDDPHVRQLMVELVGSSLDADHLAYYASGNGEREVRDKVMSDEFQPTYIYMGTSAIRFDPRGRIFIGYHAGYKERATKEVFLQRSAQARVLPVIADKIGYAGGLSLDLLTVDNLDTSPIYLVATPPQEGDVKGKDRFQRAEEAFLGDSMQHAIGRHEGLVIHWITVESVDGDAAKVREHLVMPREASKDLGL